MGQKVNPVAYRLGITREWDSVWWNEKSLGKWIVEDEKIRKIVAKKFRAAEIDRVKIERTPGFIRLVIKTGKPALLIGQKGQEIESLKNQIMAIIEDKNNTKLDIKIEEVKKINLSAQILATNLSFQIERNTPFKRAMKKLMGDAMKDGAKGIKIRVSGRLAGAEMARIEWYAEGRIPTQTLRADIDYATAEALTKYGLIGIKVWLFKGEVLGKKNLFVEEEKGTERERKPFQKNRKNRNEETQDEGVVLKKRTAGNKKPSNKAE